VATHLRTSASFAAGAIEGHFARIALIGLSRVSQVAEIVAAG